MDRKVVKCKFFMEYGSCRKGDNCKFFHPVDLTEEEKDALFEEKNHAKKKAKNAKKAMGGTVKQFEDNTFYDEEEEEQELDPSQMMAIQKQLKK